MEWTAGVKAGVLRLPVAIRIPYAYPFSTLIFQYSSLPIKTKTMTVYRYHDGQ